MVYRQCVEILTVDCLQNYVPIEPLDHSIVGVVKSLVTTPTSTHLHLSGKFLITLFLNIRADTQCMTGIIKSEEWLFPCLSRTSLLEYNKLMTRNKGTSETEKKRDLPSNSKRSKSRHCSLWFLFINCQIYLQQISQLKNRQHIITHTHSLYTYILTTCCIAVHTSISVYNS